MVFVKVRETYDLHTQKGKMTLIGIHTPKPDIIIRNYPGLLMQCKAYRPVSCNVVVASASRQPMDPLGVGVAEGEIAPEDLFNPLLYKAVSNVSMSNIESRIAGFVYGGNPIVADRDVDGSSAAVDRNSMTPTDDEFALYYGFLSDTHGWRHADPQHGLEMNNLRPLVYEMLYNVGANPQYSANADNNIGFQCVGSVSGETGAISTSVSQFAGTTFRGSAKPMPWLETTVITNDGVEFTGFKNNGPSVSGSIPANSQQKVPFVNVMVGAIIVPPSRLHELYYRMVVEWTIEFSQIRSIIEITDFNGVRLNGLYTHYQTYDYSNAKALAGVENDSMEQDTTMVSTSADIKKVM